MGERIRAFDWAAHPLGPPDQWPDALRMAISLCLSSSFPTAIYWGEDLHLLYNDAWSEIPADKHPAVLGKPAREAWPDIWHVVGPQFEGVMRTGEGVATYEQMLPMLRRGQVRETWWNYSMTAIRHADLSIGGVFNQGNEITAVVHARRERQAEIARWRDLFQQAPAGVALLRGPSHVFEIANDAYMRLVAGRAVLGKPVAEALPEVEEQGFIALLDRVYGSGEAHLGAATKVQLRRTPRGALEDAVLDFIYQPVRNAEGEVDGIFVLVTDVTERTRAEAALRISHWQLGEERARLAAMVEAEQRAQAALRRFNEGLEANVQRRTAELTRALQAQSLIADRLRATFETSLIYQAYLDPAGTLLDANLTSLQGIGARLHDVVGRPFWETPWFTATPGLAELVREGVAAAAAGRAVRRTVDTNLPQGTRRFDFSLRPVRNGRGEVIGIVPEAVDITERGDPPQPPRQPSAREPE